MNSICWVFISILVITLALYVVGTVLNITLLQKISEIFFVPCAGGIVIVLLQNYLPDANHIIRVTITALAFLFLAQIAAVFENFNISRIISYYLFLANIITWLDLYITTFYIYYVFYYVIAIAAACYTVYLLIMLIHCRKQKKSWFIGDLIFYIPAALINFCAIITLVHSRRSYSYLLTAGTGLLILLITMEAFKMAGVLKFSEKIQHIIKTALLSSSQILITVSGLLMIM